MTEAKARFSEPSSVATFFRNNLPGPPLEGLLGIRAKLETIRKGGKLYHMPRTAETAAVTTTDDLSDLETEVEVTGASSQSETDSGYGTTSFDRDATEPTRATLTFSRKPVPQQFLNRLIDIRALFTEPLLHTMSAKQRPTKGASMKLKYADHDDSLYLVIQCDKRNMKRMRKFFAQSHVKEVIGDDITIHITTGLRQLATQELKVYATTLRKASCGAMIRIKGAHGSSTATLGGVITVVKEGRRVLYGLTAGHALIRLVHNSNHPSPSCWSDGESDSDSPYDSDESTDSSDDDQSEVFLGAHNDGASWAPSEPVSHIGNITEHSFQSRSSSTNHDWALIELHPDQGFSNLIRIPCPSTTDKQACSTVLAFKSPASTRIQSPVNVIIPTSRGNQRGTLTSSTSSLLIAPGHKFIETHDVVLDDGFSLKPGDSGSWVIHETTGEVYGHVVSMDMFGEAYVMPFDNTLRDIQAHLRADYVGLPQEFEKPTDTWGSRVQIEHYSGPLEKLDATNNQRMRKGPLQRLERRRSISGPAIIEHMEESPILDSFKFQMDGAVLSTTEEREDFDICSSFSDQTFDSGYVTDFQLRPNVCTPKVSSQHSTTEDSPVHVDPKIEKGKYVRPKQQKMYCDQCNERPEGFRGLHELQRHKHAKHQRTLQKFICVHPSTNGLKVKTPILHSLEKCTACKAGKKYGAYYNAVAHLRRAHFGARPSRPKGNPAVVVASGRDPGNWPPLEELKSWVKEVWVESDGMTSPIGEKESDAMMETDAEFLSRLEEIAYGDLEQEEPRTEARMSKPCTYEQKSHGATASSITDDNFCPLSMGEAALYKLI
ncbi:hypothetical protein F4824DRAFT_245505 [Ustulina deusta]|nr:hypothetical protein F4824DRAFT_245505 [Ustulina deusta]